MTRVRMVSWTKFLANENNPIRCYLDLSHILFGATKVPMSNSSKQVQEFKTVADRLSSTDKIRHLDFYEITDQDLIDKVSTRSIVLSDYYKAIRIKNYKAENIFVNYAFSKRFSQFREIHQKDGIPAGANSMTQECTSNTMPNSNPNPKNKPKKPLKQRIIDELKHYSNGFKLLGFNIKMSFFVAIKKNKGVECSRKEHIMLRQTIVDLLKLVPFSVFIIVPFLEFILPAVLMFFPNMLPSTFQTKEQKETQFKQNLKIKLKMSEFLQDNVSIRIELAQELADFFAEIKKNGVEFEMLKFSKLFTLDSLTRPQLSAICRILDLQPVGNTMVLKYILKYQLELLTSDDTMIQKEGIDSLTLSELQEACNSRGMVVYGLTEEHLKQQLTQWLDVSHNGTVPPLLNLYSRVFRIK